MEKPGKQMVQGITTSRVDERAVHSVLAAMQIDDPHNQ